MSIKKKDEKSIPKRIPINLIRKIEKRGGGDFRAGLYHMDAKCDILDRDPSILMEKKLEEFVQTIQACASENHYEHYMQSNLSAVLFKFIKTGRVDTEILNTRIEKPLSKFEDDNNGTKNNN